MLYQLLDEGGFIQRAELCLRRFGSSLFIYKAWLHLFGGLGTGFRVRGLGLGGKPHDSNLKKDMATIQQPPLYKFWIQDLYGSTWNR